MRLIYVAIQLKVKELFYNRVYLAVLLLLPLLMSVMGIYSRYNREEISLRAGIYLEEETELGINLREILQKDESIRFMVFEDEATMEKAVSTGKIECGFIIKASIEQAAQTIGEEASIIVLVSPSTIASGPIQETVGAAFFRLTADEIALEVLKDKAYMEGVEQLKEKLGEDIASYYKQGDLMQVKLINHSKIEKMTLNDQESGVMRLGKGVVSIFLFVASLLLGAKCIRERKGGFYKYFEAVGKSIWIMEGATAIASSLYQFLFGALSLYILYGFAQEFIAWEIAKILVGLWVYIMALNSLMLILSWLIQEEQIWMGMIPVLSIASVIFSPVIIDLSSMQSVLKFGSYFFLPYYYLKGKYNILICVVVLSSFLCGLMSQGQRMGYPYKKMRVRRGEKS